MIKNIFFSEISILNSIPKLTVKLCQFQVYSEVNQLYVYICPRLFRFFSHIGHYRLLSIVPCVIWQVFISYLFYMCVYVSLSHPVYPFSLSSPLVTVFVFYICNFILQISSSVSFIYLFFLDSTQKQNATQKAIHSLTYFTEYEKSLFFETIPSINDLDCPGLSHFSWSNSLRPCGPYPTMLLCPWDSPGALPGPGIRPASHVSCTGRWVLCYQCLLGSPDCAIVFLNNGQPPNSPQLPPFYLGSAIRSYGEF